MQAFASGKPSQKAMAGMLLSMVSQGTQKSQPIKILLATKNSAKQRGLIEGVEDGLMAWATKYGIPQAEFEVRAVDIDPGYLDGQPYGIEGTFAAAGQRLVILRRDHAHDVLQSDILIAVEDGITTVQSNTRAHIWTFSTLLGELASDKSVSAFAQSQSCPCPLQFMQHANREKFISPENMGFAYAEWVKAFGIEDNRQQRVRTITTDVIGQLLWQVKTINDGDRKEKFHWERAFPLAYHTTT